MARVGCAYGYASLKSPKDDGTRLFRPKILGRISPFDNWCPIFVLDQLAEGIGCISASASFMRE